MYPDSDLQALWLKIFLLIWIIAILLLTKKVLSSYKDSLISSLVFSNLYFVSLFLSITFPLQNKLDFFKTTFVFVSLACGSVVFVRSLILSRFNPFEAIRSLHARNFFWIFYFALALGVQIGLNALGWEAAQKQISAGNFIEPFDSLYFSILCLPFIAEVFHINYVMSENKVNEFTSCLFIPLYLIVMPIGLSNLVASAPLDLEFSLSLGVILFIYLGIRLAFRGQWRNLSHLGLGTQLAKALVLAAVAILLVHLWY